MGNPAEETCRPTRIGHNLPRQARFVNTPIVWFFNDIRPRNDPLKPVHHDAGDGRAPCRLWRNNVDAAAALEFRNGVWTTALAAAGDGRSGGSVKMRPPKPGVRLKVGEGEAEAERGSATRSKLERKIGVVKPAASRAGGRAAGHRPALRKSSRQTIPLPSVLTHF